MVLTVAQSSVYLHWWLRVGHVHLVWKPGFGNDKLLVDWWCQEERERERRIQRERAAREVERRRLRELDRERRLQQEEADRVARERERLRYRMQLDV